jgi:hypothetical protein
MTNHFHLLLRSREGQLAAGMQFLSGRFTLINVHVGRDGPLFHGRYASVLVDSDTHTVQACRYIHMNPVVAGIASTPETWPWSSAAAYVGTVETQAWLKTNFILDLFGPRHSLTAYREFMMAGVDTRTRDFYAGIGW